MPPGIEENVLYLDAGKQFISSYEVPLGGKLWVLGDPIGKGLDPDRVIAADGAIDLNQLYKDLSGHYYWFWIKGKQLRLGSSFGGITPVYYNKQDDGTYICSSSVILAEQTHAPADDRRYILERLLFHYPLFNSTWYSSIKLLPAHSQLSWNEDQVSIQRTLDFTGYAGHPSRSGKKDLRQLADQFIDSCNDFMPASRFGISLTGGFDGRTLVGVGRKYRRDFFTYSFGESNSSDIMVPAQQALTLGLQYKSIILGDKYLENNASEALAAFMSLTDFHGNIGRPHYYYSAALLGQDTPVIMTGNFGSELFRALHLPGMMMTRQLIDVFSSRDNRWKDRLNEYVKSWAQSKYDQELEALIEDLDKYLNESGLDGNPRFYRFVYEELFRKYFGPEIIMQSHFLNNRTPYLQYEFVRALNQTVWSGVHRPLFEESKFKRMIGQFFYAQVLRNSDDKLYRLKTSKGYAPNDVGESWRKPILLYRYLIQKLNKNEVHDDNNVFVIINRFMHDSPLDVIPGTGISFKGLDRDTLINWLSIAYGITKLNANHYASTTY
ncbi:MAG: hypothetical protein H6570_09400 [Lewinellaceae bacterium]|nr:hypothetical protein [Lewinellaceae bacterium]